MSNLKSTSQNSNLKSSNVKVRAYEFSLVVIVFVKSFPEKRIYWIFADQLLRAATSIGANLIESRSSSSRRDFIKFVEIALKSANETKYWLCLLRDSNLVEKASLNRLLAEADEISKMLASSLLTLKGKKNI